MSQNTAPLALDVEELEPLEAPSFWEGFKVGFPVGAAIGIAVIVTAT